MWAVVEKGISGYRVYGERKGLQEFKRVDGFLNEIKRYDLLFIIGSKSDFQKFLEKHSFDYAKKKIISISDIFPKLTKGQDVFKALNILIDEGFDISKESLGAYAGQLVYRKVPNDFFTLKTDEVILGEMAFYGGRNENLVKVYEGDDLVFYDINSAYPYLLAYSKIPLTMYNKEFEKLELESPDLVDLKMFYQKGYTGVAYVRASLDGNIPKLPVKYDGIYYPNGVIEGWYHLPEVFLLNKSEILGIDRAFLYKQVESPFKYQVLKMIELRKKYPELKSVFKGIAVAMYGVISKKNGGNRLVGGYITSLQRARLYRAIELLENNGFKVLYYDTDSLLVDVKGQKEEVDRLLDISDKLGAWSIRKEGIRRFECGGVKQYRLIYDGKDEFVWKGLKDAVNVLYKDALSGIVEYEEETWNGISRVRLEFKPEDKRKFISEDYSVPFKVEELNQLKGGINDERVSKSVSPSV